MRTFRKQLALTLMLAVTGFVGGAIMSPAPIRAAEEVSCEQDECEKGWFGHGSCVDNAGNLTSCNMVGDDCVTGGC